MCWAVRADSYVIRPAVVVEAARQSVVWIAAARWESNPPFPLQWFNPPLEYPRRPVLSFFDWCNGGSTSIGWVDLSQRILEDPQLCGYSPASGAVASPKRSAFTPMRSISDRYRLQSLRLSSPRPV